MKSALRKKGGTVVDTEQSASHVTKPKRKRSLNPAADDDNDQARDDADVLPGAAKRRKGRSEAEKDGTAPGIDEASSTKSHTLVPSSRAVKRYRARKGRTSSPATLSHSSVNYDRIPDAPPSAAVDTHAESTGQSMKIAKPSVAVVEPGVTVEKKRVKPRMVTKAEPINIDPPNVMKPSKTTSKQPNKIDGQTKKTRRVVTPEVVEVSSPDERPTEDSSATVSTSVECIKVSGSTSCELILLTSGTGPGCLCGCDIGSRG